MCTVTLVGYIILFEGMPKFLDSRSYWEQVLLCFGFIASFFAYQVYEDGRKLKLREKDFIIDNQRKTIDELEKKIRQMMTS